MVNKATAGSIIILYYRRKYFAFSVLECHRCGEVYYSDERMVLLRVRKVRMIKVNQNPELAKKMDLCLC